jgi:hypothetical protein
MTIANGYGRNFALDVSYIRSHTDDDNNNDDIAE